MVDFILTYAKMIAREPDDIKVSSEEIDKNFIEITIKANENDIGKIIGKSGNMINSLKTIANGCKAKNNISYKIQVVAN